MARLRFLADEDFDNAALRGAIRRLPEFEVVRVQDVGLSGQSDARVLEWAASEGRVLLTHDASTMKTCAFQRVKNGLRMPGIFVVQQSLPTGKVIEAILLLSECSLEDEWEGQVRHLPL